MRLDSLASRIKSLEKAAGRETIILSDGAKWTPRHSLLDMFVDLMDFECGEISKDLSPDFVNEARMWAKYGRRPGNPPFYGMMGDMARNLLEVI
jgi:hypothetical protein